MSSLLAASFSWFTSLTEGSRMAATTCHCHGYRKFLYVMGQIDRSEQQYRTRSKKKKNKKKQKQSAQGLNSFPYQGWSDGAMVLGKLPVPGRLTNSDDSRTRAYCACSGCGWGGLDIFSLLHHFFSPPSFNLSSFSLSPSLSERRSDID